MTTRTISRTGVKWSVPRYKHDWLHICAILPAYLDNGTNGTEVLYLDGSNEAVEFRLQWVLDDLLGYLRTSKAILAKESKRYLGKHARRVPLLVSKDMSLVPVKAREPIGDGDTVSGYVVMEHVADVIPYTDENRIYFSDSVYITVQDKTNTLWHNLNLAKELKQQMSA